MRDDGTGDDDVAGTGGERGGRSADAALIVRAGVAAGGEPLRADTGNDQAEVRPTGVQRRYLVAGGDQAIGSTALRQGSKAFHLLRDGAGDAGDRKVSGIEAGQDGYGDEQGGRGAGLPGLAPGPRARRPACARRQPRAR